MTFKGEDLARLILLPLIQEVENMTIRYKGELKYHEYADFYVVHTFISLNGVNNHFAYKTHLDKMCTNIKYDAEEKISFAKNLEVELDTNHFNDILDDLSNKVLEDSTEDTLNIFKGAHYQIQGAHYTPHPIYEESNFSFYLKEGEEGTFLNDDLLPFAKQIQAVITDIRLGIQFLLVEQSVKPTDSGSLSKECAAIPDALKDRIIELVQENDIRTALNTLVQFSKEHRLIQLNEDLTFLTRSFNKLEKDQLQGTISREGQTLEENRVIKGIFSILKK